MYGIAGIVHFDNAQSAQALGEAALWMQRCLAPGAARRGLWQQGRAALVFAAPPDSARVCQPVRMVRGACEWVAVYEGMENPADVLAGYIEWGMEWIAALRGPFALAVWQPFEERLLLARDSHGGKPLLCARTQGGLAFASDEAALLCLADWTRVAQIEPLPPGCSAHIGQDLVTLDTWV